MQRTRSDLITPELLNREYLFSVWSWERARKRPNWTLYAQSTHVTHILGTIFSFIKSGNWCIKWVWIRRAN